MGKSLKIKATKETAIFFDRLISEKKEHKKEIEQKLKEENIQHIQ